MPLKSKELRKLYMRQYRAKRKKRKQQTTQPIDVTSRYTELSQLLKCSEEEIAKRLHGTRPHINLTLEEIEIVEKSFGLGQAKDCTKRVSKKFLNEVHECVNCRTNPCVIIVLEDERIGLCENHWKLLANSDVGW